MAYQKGDFNYHIKGVKDSNDNDSDMKILHATAIHTGTKCASFQIKHKIFCLVCANLHTRFQKERFMNKLRHY